MVSVYLVQEWGSVYRGEDSALGCTFLCVFLSAERLAQRLSWHRAQEHPL